MDLRNEQITSFFRCSSKIADRIRSQALEKLRLALLSKAQRIGLLGTGYQNCLEDWINEGYIAAEEQIDRWDRTLCGPDYWVFLKSQDIASRWFERFYIEYRRLQELTLKGSSLVHDGRGQAEEQHGLFHESDFILSILKEDLSASDSRILRLHLKGHPISEIAELEGLSGQTTQRRLNRAQARARSARDRKDVVVPLSKNAKVRKNQRRASL